MSTLREARVEKQASADGTGAWTQHWVAERVGVTEKTVRRWEAGTLPRPFMQKRLAHLFGVAWEELWP